MKKYILKTFIFILPIIVLGIIMEIAIRKIPNDYIYKKEYLDNNSDEIEMLYLGSSHTYYGINPQFLIGNSFNASHISQSLDSDFKLIKKYEGNWSKLKHIVIPIDYFSLFTNIKTSNEKWRIKNYLIYYNIHNSYKIYNHFETLSIDLKTNLNRLYSYYLKDNSEITCSKLGYGNIRQKTKNLKESGEIAAKRHTIKDISLINKNISILIQTLQFASKNNIKLILYTSPAYHTYVSNLSSTQLKISLKVCNYLSEENENCFYYNLLEDNSFDKIDFRDADHLNQEGAKKLSLKLDSLIINK